ncbi:MAG: histidine kinase [Bacteroidales bacterium]|nr:histidine kinase [Bacteroidales bacterium]MBN2763705.1 histidine kinase [Bacteroidales bacterium]
MKKSTCKKLFWLYYHGGLLIFSLFVAMIMKYSQTGKALTPETLVPFGTIFVMSILMGYLAIYMLNRAAKLPYQKMMKQMVPGLIIFFILSFLIANIVISLGVFIWFLVNRWELNSFIPHLLRNELGFASLRMGIWFLFFSIFFFYILWRKSFKKEMDLQKEILKFQYQTLKSQVNPHFLFNSLNTLSSIVYDNPKKADHYIQRLSSIYRYVIENEKTELISLEKEITFVQDFFSLLQERDRDKITMKVDVSHPEKYKILPVSLQLLVENAIKHNAASRENPLEISIRLEDEHIVVSNRVQRKDTLENSTQTGLQNLKERIRLVLNKELICMEDNHHYIVKVPLIHSSI